MTQEQILATLVEAVSQMQTQCQRDVPPLRLDTRLIGDVPGFDSLLVVDLCILLTDHLEPELKGREIPDAVLLGTGCGVRPTLGEIATAITEFLNNVPPARSSSRRRKQDVSAVGVTSVDLKNFSVDEQGIASMNGHRSEHRVCNDNGTSPNDLDD